MPFKVKAIRCILYPYNKQIKVIFLLQTYAGQSKVVGRLVYHTPTTALSKSKKNSAIEKHATEILILSFSALQVSERTSSDTELPLVPTCDTLHFACSLKLPNMGSCR